VAAWVPVMFVKFYLIKSNKIAKKNSTTTLDIGKISIDLESLEFKKFLM
jgi:hypothetical protein